MNTSDYIDTQTLALASDPFFACYIEEVKKAVGAIRECFLGLNTDNKILLMHNVLTQSVNVAANTHTRDMVMEIARRLPLYNYESNPKSSTLYGYYTLCMVCAKWMEEKGRISSSTPPPIPIGIPLSDSCDLCDHPITRTNDLPSIPSPRITFRQPDPDQPEKEGT